MNRFKLIALSTFLLLLGFALLVGGLAPYYLFYIFLLSLIIPLIHNLLIYMNIDGHVKVPHGALHTGDEVELEYRLINNSSLLAPYVKVKSNISRLLTGKEAESTIVSLRGKSGYTKRDTLVLDKRGYFELGEIDVEIQDIFSLYTLKKSIKSNASLLVYPEIINLSSLGIRADNKSGELLTDNSLFQDKNSISSLRDYREGDPIKSIHWKLTAKSNNAIVKEFEYRVNTNALVFLDNQASLYKDDFDRRLEDKSVDVSLSIINYYLKQNLEVILETQNEGRLIRIKGKDQSDLKSYLEELTRLRGNGLLPIESLILPQLDTIREGSTLIIVTPRLDRTIGSLVIEAKLKRLHPLLIITSDKDNQIDYFDSQIEKRLLQESIAIYIIDYKTSIKEILEVHGGS